MKKLNGVIYNKLLAQAEEAKHQGLTKLANTILESIGNEPENEVSEYSYNDLKNDVHIDMWKMATRLMRYYDIKSLDAEKLDDTIMSCASKILKEIEQTMGVDNIVIGPFEPKTFGEK